MHWALHPREPPRSFSKTRIWPFPPQYGPLAAVTPGTPGGLMTMLAEFGTMSLKQVLQPSMEMADGYPMEASPSEKIERDNDHIKEWPYSKPVLLRIWERSTKRLILGRYSGSLSF